MRCTQACVLSWFPPCTRRHGRDGQAMVEFVVALLCILAVLSGILQIVLMGAANTDTLAEATALAASRATAGVLLAGTPDILADWDAGPDGMEQTQDDRPVPGSLAGVQRNIAGVSAPGGDWSALADVRHRRMTELHHGLLPSSTFGLVRGSASRTVDVLPAARVLFGLRDRVAVRNEVWMTAVGGLY